MLRFLLLAPLIAAVPAISFAAGPPLAVQFVQIQETPLTFDVKLTGTITARDSIDLSFPQGGRITRIPVQAGDRVRAGQSLAETDGVQQQQALNQAIAGVAAADAAQQQAAQAKTRADEMLRRGVGTRAARDAAQQALSEAEGQLESARTTADQARRAAEDTILKAPQDAVVTARTAEPGQVVGAAQPILTLAALTGIEAVFQVPDVPGLDSAQGARVTLVPLDRRDQTLTGHVSEIAPLVDAATGSVTVRARIDAPPASAAAMDTTLLGAAVLGTVHLPAGTGIEVPWTALTSAGTEPAVWRISADGTVEIVPVQIERFTTSSVVLKSGVKAGETVVGEGSQLLYPGRPVVAGILRP